VWFVQADTTRVAGQQFTSPGAASSGSFFRVSVDLGKDSVLEPTSYLKGRQRIAVGASSEPANPNLHLDRALVNGGAMRLAVKQPGESTDWVPNTDGWFFLADT